VHDDIDIGEFDESTIRKKRLLKNDDA